MLAVSTNGWLDEGRAEDVDRGDDAVGEDYLVGKVQRSPIAMGQSHLTR